MTSSTKSEEALLSLALEGHLPQLLERGISDQHFTGANLEVWQLLKRQLLEQKPTDLSSVTAVLYDTGKEALVAVLAEVLREIYPPSNMEHYVAECRGAAFRRQARQRAEAFLKQCDTEPDVSVLRAAAAEFATGILAPETARHESMRDICMGILDEMQQRMDGEIPGYRTGLVDVDGLIGCMLPGELIIISGAAKSGKTALMVQVLVKLALEGVRCGLVSLEMTGREVVSRILGSEARINLLKFRDPKTLTDYEFPRLSAAHQRIIDLPLSIREDIHDLAGIAGILRVWAAQGVKVVAVDYIQLIAGYRHKGDSREREVASISRELKVLAKELGLVVIAGSQLNDDGKLRESRAIGQDANMVLSVDKVDGEPNLRFIRITASRSGPGDTGKRVTYLSAYTRFENYAAEEQVSEQKPKTNRRNYE